MAEKTRSVFAITLAAVASSCGSSHLPAAGDAASIDAAVTCPANELCLELLAGSLDKTGSVDGTGTNARFSIPSGIAVDGTGNVYVADTNNHTIRKVTPEGVVATIAGMPGNHGSADGTGSGAQFFFPNGVTVDNGGNLYVADSINDTIRQVTAAGVVTTLAGYPGMFGSADGTRQGARFNGPLAVAADGSGNVYVSDTSNCTIRKVTTSPPPAGVVTTLAGVAGECCTATGGVNCVSRDGTGSAARFISPSGLALDEVGNIYVADDNAIRKVTPAGVVTTLAGQNESYSSGSADGLGSAASFSGASGVAVDGRGNVYVADTFNALIRRVTPLGVVTTVAGIPNPGGPPVAGLPPLDFGGPTTLGTAPSFTDLYDLKITGSSLIIADGPSGYADTNAIVVLENVVECERCVAITSYSSRR